MADRAVRWLEEVIAGHGTNEGSGRIRVPLSQAALARATARSAGTVSYYLRCLGPLVERRDGALVVDVAALAERRTERRQRRAQVAERLTCRFGQVTADGSAMTETVRRLCGRWPGNSAWPVIDAAPPPCAGERRPRRT